MLAFASMTVSLYGLETCDSKYRERDMNLLIATILVIIFPAAADAPPIPPEVKVTVLGHGWLFTDSAGMTLYTSERDAAQPGASTCVDVCTETWRPLTTAGSARPVGDWSTIGRPDGAAQWAFRGLPVYTYAKDPVPGATLGDGFGQIWRLALLPMARPAEATVATTLLGQTLADSRGFTLYARSDGKTCDVACLKTWSPLEAPALARGFADWSVQDRGDGARQWLFKGKALFTYAGDVNGGETHGARQDAWHAVILEPARPFPAWVTVQKSDAGELYADARGMTIYTHTPKSKAECQDASCVPDEWRPVIAEAGAEPVGDWWLEPLASGKAQVADAGAVTRDAPTGPTAMQWTFKGSRVYTNANDRLPGDFKGIRYGGDRSYAAIMLSGDLMPGVKGDGSSFLQ
jgi:predicted lipoprotein with Yx(FWY)xxD motif